MCSRRLNAAPGLCSAQRAAARQCIPQVCYPTCIWYRRVDKSQGRCLVILGVTASQLILQGFFAGSVVVLQPNGDLTSTSNLLTEGPVTKLSLRLEEAVAGVAIRAKGIPA